MGRYRLNNEDFHKEVDSHHHWIYLKCHQRNQERGGRQDNRDQHQDDRDENNIGEDQETIRSYWWWLLIRDGERGVSRDQDGQYQDWHYFRLQDGDFRHLVEDWSHWVQDGREQGRDQGRDGSHDGHSERDPEEEWVR